MIRGISICGFLPVVTTSCSDEKSPWSQKQNQSQKFGFGFAKPLFSSQASLPSQSPWDLLLPVYEYISLYV
jgi:hypothetical protein